MKYTSIRDFLCVFILLVLPLLNNFTIHGQGIVGGGLDINDETTSGDLTINSGDAISRELQATGVDSFVGGPGGDRWPNKVTNGYAFVGAGGNNIASGYASSIVGGVNNIAGGQLSFIGAGFYDEAPGEDSFIGSGEDNVASGDYASIVAGLDNLAGGNFSSIVSGVENYAAGVSSFIRAGQNKKAQGKVSVVSGGNMNTASGLASVIIGGSNNTATGDYSIAMGVNADAKKDRSFVINLGKKGDDVSSNKKDEFLVNSDSFTLQIGKKDVTIDKKNIQNFKNLLKNNSDDRRRHLEHINKINKQSSKSYTNRSTNMKHELSNNKN